MAKRPTIDKSFIREQHGKEFVLVAGLFELGHRRGWCGCDTEVDRQLSNPEKDFYVVRAVGKFRSEETGGEESFTGWGDAGPANSQMKGAYLRHAETRAIARMLRMATNVGMTAWEEMGPDAEATTTGAGQTGAGVREQGGARRPNERVRHAESRGNRAANPAAPASAAASAVAPVEGYIYQSPEDRLEQAKDESTILTYCQARGCREILTAREAEGCRKRPEWFDGKEFCTKHAREYRQQQAGLSQANLPEGQIAA